MPTVDVTFDFPGYDALSRRTYEDSTTSNGTASATTHLYYDNNGQVIQEVGSNDRENVWSPLGTNELVERDDTTSSGTSTRRLYAEQNANWSTTSLSNSSGAVVERYVYNPYGSVTVLNASFTPISGNASAYGMQYLFQGGRIDPSSGLYRFGARDYDPKLGTWIEADPSGYPDGADRYALEGDIPVNSTDPSGLNAISDDNEGGEDLDEILAVEKAQIDARNSSNANSGASSPASDDSPGTIASELSTMFPGASVDANGNLTFTYAGTNSAAGNDGGIVSRIETWLMGNSYEPDSSLSDEQVNDALTSDSNFETDWWSKNNRGKSKVTSTVDSSCLHPYLKAHAQNRTSCRRRGGIPCTQSREQRKEP